MAAAVRHTCEAPACDLPTGADMLACRKHWYKLPGSLREKITNEWRSRGPSRKHAELKEQAQTYWSTHR